MVVAIVFYVPDLHARYVACDEGLRNEMMDIDVVGLAVSSQSYASISVTVVAGLKKGIGVYVHDLAVRTHSVVWELLNTRPNLIVHLFPVLPALDVVTELLVLTEVVRVEAAHSSVLGLCPTVGIPALSGVDLRFH